MAPSAPRPHDPAPASREVAATLLETRGWEDYELLDTGNGRKLERFGRITVDRPEPQALWAPKAPDSAWAAADASFEAQEEAEQGAWRAKSERLPEWTMRYGDLRVLCRATSFRHVGIFPEQIVHWEWMDARIRAAPRPLNVLNLFGYTGMASLVAAAAGARVTHVDASRKAIAWARENQAESGLEDRPIRWICDDAMKFVQREVRRGSTYDAILLDPPKFGRGPGNETWRLFEDLPVMLEACRAILSPEPSFMILTSYAVRLSYLTLYELMRDAVAERGGRLDAGELVVQDRHGGRRLSTSLYARWTAGEAP